MSMLGTDPFASEAAPEVSAPESAPAPAAPEPQPAPEPENAPARDSAQASITKAFERVERDNAGDQAPDSKPDATTPEPETPVSAPRAPQSWKPGAREKFAGLDPEIKAEITRREREIQTTLQSTAEDRKMSSSFREAVTPYEPLLRQIGVTNTPQAVGALLQREAALWTARPEVRAQIFAQGIRDYLGSDDQAIMLLADEIQRGASGAPQPQQQPQISQQQIDAMVAQKYTAAAIQEFQAEQPKFINEVSGDMMALLQVEQSRGKTTLTRADLHDAYRKACLLNPEVSARIEQWEAARAAEKVNASTQRAKAASVSVRSQPAGRSPSPVLGDDTRSHLEAAWDRAERD